MKNKSNLPLNYTEKSHSRISLFCSVLVLLLLVFAICQTDYQLVRKPAKEASQAAAERKMEQERLATIPQVTKASVLAVGDNLFHSSLCESGRKESGEWNYDHIYANVLDEIRAADVAIVDQETVLTSEHDNVSAYPIFATPVEVGHSLMTAGFDVIYSATNHIDDKGFDTLQQTFDFWKNNYPEVPVLGIHETPEDAEEVKTLTVNDITFGFLNYTYGTNTNSLGEDKAYMIDIFDKDKISAMVQKAKEVSDVVIFIAHWGNEDEPYPSEYEKEWAAFLLQQGVDVLIGGHPHVLQPYGRMYDDKGNEMLIFYSLGNFVSTQQELPELLGGMAKFTVEKTSLNGVSSIRILDQTVEPLVMHWNHDYGVYAVYMLKDYTEDLALTHGVRNLIGNEFTLENLQKKFKEIMSINVEPSEKTYLLNVRFDWDGSLYDKTTGEYVYDADSITYWQYYNSLSQQN